MRPVFKLFLPVLAVFVMPACAAINPQSATPTPIPSGLEIRGLFAGMTPCSVQAKLLFQIPARTDCEQMIWHLVLYQDPQTGVPATFSLKTSYGLSKQGTNDLIDGGTSISMEGNWRLAAGTKNDPEAAIYQIDPDDPQTTISFLRVNEDLIHVLDREQAMLVGNGAWSYTLNRMGHESPAQAYDRPWWSPDPPTRPPQPPMPDGSSIFGVFDGRTPCHQVALDFTGTATSDCLKIKWRLSLYQDSATGEPGRYLYMGTSAYREGSWRIVHDLDLDGDPDAVIYELQPDGDPQSFYFLQVDDNHLFLMDNAMNLLVGNEFFSYTLSRTEEETQ